MSYDSIRVLAAYAEISAKKVFHRVDIRLATFYAIRHPIE